MLLILEKYLVFSHKTDYVNTNYNEYIGKADNHQTSIVMQAVKHIEFTVFYQV